MSCIVALDSDIGDMQCMHRRALAAYSVQHAAIGLLSFQSHFCEAVLLTMSVANLHRMSVKASETLSPGSVWDYEMR